MLRDWIGTCLDWSGEKADFYASSRKILTNKHVSFTRIENDLKLRDAGYTKSKMTMLRKNYLHEESIRVAVGLWERRKEQAKYGSVGFTTYNHFIKNDPNRKSKRASVMGPCIQSVTLTWNKRGTTIDVFYRTTEFFKKFPADLVFLRDVLLPHFDFSGCEIERVNFHFANVSMHPMYFVTIIPLLADSEAIAFMEGLKEKDEYFYKWLVKWTARYLCDEYNRGIQKFCQALRVQKDAFERIDPDQLPELQDYLRANHPGFRGYYKL